MSERDDRILREWREQYAEQLAHGDVSDDDEVRVRRDDLKDVLDAANYRPDWVERKYGYDAVCERLNAAAEGPALPREEPAGYVVLHTHQWFWPDDDERRLPGYAHREDAQAFVERNGGTVYALVARPLAEGE